MILLIAIMKSILYCILFIVLSSCVMAPFVNSDVQLRKTPNMMFYVIGSPRYGINYMIADRIIENYYKAEVVDIKQNIPVQSGRPNENTLRQYIVSHEYRMESTTDSWKLTINIYTYNPRGVDELVVEATSVGNFTTRELVNAAIDNIFKKIDGRM